MNEVLLSLLAGGALIAFMASVLGLAWLAAKRLAAWWRAGQKPHIVRIEIVGR